MERIKKKGQWLAAGGFLIISILAAVVLTKTTIDFGAFDRTEENRVFSVIAGEFDNTLRILVNESTTSQQLIVPLKDYLSFAENYAIGRSLQAHQFVVVGLPTATGLNITAVNYYNQPVNDFALTVNGVAAVVTDIPHGENVTYSFAGITNTYNVTYVAEVLDRDGDKFNISETVIFDRRAFGIAELEVRARDYVRREVIVR